MKFSPISNHDSRSILDDVRGSDVDDLNEFISDRKRSANLRHWLSRFVVDVHLRSRGFRDSPVFRALLEVAFAEACRLHQESENELFADRAELDAGMLRHMASSLRKSKRLDDIEKWAAVNLDPFVRGARRRTMVCGLPSGSLAFRQTGCGQKVHHVRHAVRDLQVGAGTGAP